MCRTGGRILEIFLLLIEVRRDDPPPSHGQKKALVKQYWEFFLNFKPLSEDIYPTYVSCM